jgi:hypothetical protein
MGQRIPRNRGDGRVRFLRWFSTPYYGALFAPLLLLARQLVLWLLAGVGLGAAGAVAVRRLLK